MKMRSGFNSKIYVFVVLGCLLQFAIPGAFEVSSVWADEVQGEKVEHLIYERDRVEFEIYPDSHTIDMIDGLSLIISATVKDGEAFKLELDEKSKDSLNNDFELVGGPKISKLESGAGEEIWRFEYKLLPRLTGNVEIPSLSFEYSFGGVEKDEKLSVETEPVPITVKAYLSDEESRVIAGEEAEAGEVIEELTDIDIQDGPVELKGDKLWVVWAGGLAAALIIAAFVAVRRRGKTEAREQIIYRSAFEAAMEMLEKLDRASCLESGNFAVFFERISNILRYYMECRFEIRATEQTTEEFFEELKVSDILDSSKRKELGEFFELCDIVKFAKHRPGKDEMLRGRELVENFVQNTRDDECMVAVTNNKRLLKLMEV